MTNDAQHLTEVNAAHGDPQIAIETGAPSRPWVLSHDPKQYDPCGDCGGIGSIYDEGSAPDPAVGWRGQEPTEEQCTACDHGWVRIGGAA